MASDTNRGFWASNTVANASDGRRISGFVISLWSPGDLEFASYLSKGPPNFEDFSFASKADAERAIQALVHNGITPDNIAAKNRQDVLRIACSALLW